MKNWDMLMTNSEKIEWLEEKIKTLKRPEAIAEMQEEIDDLKRRK